MCGLVGFAGQIEVKHERAFNELLIMDQLRGFDSVGVMRVGYQRHPDVLKSLSSPVDFILSPEYTKLMRGQHNMLAGHNRAATSGKVTIDNAHPFTHGTITGMHNGTLPTRYRLEDNKDFDVDSDNIFYHIHKKGVKDLWINMFGAASLVWWDAKNESLNFLRNNERPLYMAYTKDRKALCWASEFFMLQAACWRNGIPLDGAPFATKINTLYTIPIGEGWRRGQPIVTHEEAIPEYDTTYYAKWNTDRSAYHKDRPDWLKIGNRVTVMFDEVEEADGVRLKTYKGFCPADDRVNVIYHVPSGVKEVVDMGQKGCLYRATINSLLTRWVSGLQEFDIRVGNVTNFKEDALDGHVKEASEIEKEELAALMDELNEDNAPFENAGTKGCETLCPFKSNKACKKCQRAFKGKYGTWTFQTSGYAICDWCGGFHRPNDVAYIFPDAQESYCMDCFDSAVDWIIQRNAQLGLQN